MPVKDWSTTDADNDDADLSNNINWQEGQAPSTVNNTGRAMMTQVKRWFDEVAGGTMYIAAGNVGGTANAITLTTDQAESYGAGQRFMFLAKSDTTDAVTVNVDSQGTRAVKSHGDPLASGAIKSGDVVIIADDGTDYELVYPRRIFASGSQFVNMGTGASSGPIVTLYRDSSSPAADDLLGTLKFSGNDSAGNEQRYAEILADIQSPTSTSETGRMYFRTINAGTFTNRVVVRNGLYTSNATGGDQGTDTVNATDYYRDGVIVGGTLIAVIEDQKSSGTDGGTFTSGADQTRDLNTEVFDLANVVSVGSNQITLDAGDYIVKWSAPAKRVNSHQSLLYDVTNTSEVKRGTSEKAGQVTGSESETIEVQTRSEGAARVTPGSSTVYEIRHRCQTSSGSEGFGGALGGGTEVYTRVEIYAV